ncbi:MAG: thioredoxin domain-containing protein [Tenacibaculum sp.]
MYKLVLIPCFLFAFSVVGQQVNFTTTDAKGNPILLGKTNKDAFKNESFSWFNINYNNYLTNDKVINHLKDSLNNSTIKVFYGSWCGDSKRELPKFYKVIDEVDFDKNKLEVIAVDKKPEAYKTSPNGEEKGLNIHRVPTFIFYKNNKEIGRIVESPKQDFERDIFAITSQKKYTPQYMVVEYLHKLLNESSIIDLQKEQFKLTTYLAEYTKGSRELNTYGYKLLRSKQIEKALFIFELNTKMYPYKANVFDSLAEAFYTIKNYEMALKNYDKALSLKPNDKDILAMIDKIKTEMMQ